MQNQNFTKRRPQSVYSVKKADIVLIIVCLLVAAFIGIIFVLYHSEGSMARISCNGAEVAVIALEESRMRQGEMYFLIQSTGPDATIETFEEYPDLPEEGSFNLISVKDGKVTMVAADCRDHICVQHRPVSASGESIICLPHKIVIEITDHDEGGRDNSEELQELEDEDPDGILDGVVG